MTAPGLERGYTVRIIDTHEGHSFATELALETHTLAQAVERAQRECREALECGITGTRFEVLDRRGIVKGAGA